MRMRAAQKDDFGRFGKADIRDEFAAPAQMPRVLLAQNRGADAKAFAR